MEAVKACSMPRLLDWTRYQRLALTVVSKYNKQSKKPGRYGAVDVCVCVWAEFGGSVESQRDVTPAQGRFQAKHSTILAVHFGDDAQRT